MNSSQESDNGYIRDVVEFRTHSDTEEGRTENASS